VTSVGATAVNTYMEGKMGLYPNSIGQLAGHIHGTKLQLEEALGTLTAAMAWIVNAEPIWGLSENDTEEAIVQVIDRLNQLQIRIQDLIAGFTVSLLLCALSLHLSWPSTISIDRSQLPDSLGVLQVLWLAGRSPSIARNVANRALDPSLQSLRRAGMADRQGGLLGVETRSVAGWHVSW